MYSNQMIPYKFLALSSNIMGLGTIIEHFLRAKASIPPASRKTEQNQAALHKGITVHQTTINTTYTTTPSPEQSSTSSINIHFPLTIYINHSPNLGIEKSINLLLKSKRRLKSKINYHKTFNISQIPKTKPSPQQKVRNSRFKKK